MTCCHRGENGAHIEPHTCPVASGNGPHMADLPTPQDACHFIVGLDVVDLFALNSPGRLAATEGRYAAARSPYSESKGLFRRVGDKWGAGQSSSVRDLRRCTRGLRGC